MLPIYPREVCEGIALICFWKRFFFEKHSSTKLLSELTKKAPAFMCITQVLEAKKGWEIARYTGSQSANQWHCAENERLCIFSLCSVIDHPTNIIWISAWERGYQIMFWYLGWCIWYWYLCHNNVGERNHGFKKYAIKGSDKYPLCWLLSLLKRNCLRSCEKGKKIWHRFRQITVTFSQQPRQSMTKGRNNVWESW